ncbi:MAG: PilZ domain-containing protein [Terriglobales bacterium]
MSLELHSARTAVAERGPVRRHPRTLFSVPLMLRHLVTGGIRSLRGISLDIGEGGLGAIVQGDLRVGEMVEVDVHIPKGPLSAVAIVRHTSNVQSGLEFLGLTAEERQQIANAIGNS